MLIQYLLALAAEVPVPTVPEPVSDSLWAFGRDLLITIATVATCWWTVGRPWWKHAEAKREKERAAREAKRAEEVAAQAAEVMQPIAEQVEAMQQQIEDIHHTTTVNGNSAVPRTLRDNVEGVREQVQTLNGNVAAIAVNQANLSARLEEHLGDERAHRHTG